MATSADRAPHPYTNPMGPFDRFAEFFIRSFGITAPTPEKRRLVVLFIVALSFGTLAFFLSAIFLFLHFMKA